MQITIDVKETIINDIGITQIQSYLEKQLKLLELQLLANKITNKLKQTVNADWETEFENARKDAWNEYKLLFLNSMK